MADEQEPSNGDRANAEARAVRILANLDAAPAPPHPPLYSAIEHGRVEEVRRLIADGTDVNREFGSRWTPLVHAIDVESDTAWQRYHEEDRESTELTELLLAAGAVLTDEAFEIARRYRNWKAVVLLERYRPEAEQSAAPDRNRGSGS